MKKLRKLLVIGVMVLSVIAMSGVAITPVNASASAGDLIKMAGNSSVYYLGSDNKRYVFPNSTTYFSWYKDFSGVVTIPASELQSYLLGGNVTMRPGTKLVKITTDPSVYAVEPNGVLRKIQSEAQASALYGINWAQRVVDVPDAFFTNYSIGSVLANGAMPVGSLVKNSGSSDIYYYDGTNYRKIADEAALAANNFELANVITSATTITAGGTPITGAETDLVNVAQNGDSGPVATGSGLMVSLNSNTAPSTTLVYGQSLANLATFNFTASNDGDAKVTSLKLKRTGVSADALLSAVYLYSGSNRITDSATVSSNYITFNNPSGLFTVAAGTTKTITVKSDISSTSGDGSNVAVSINAASDVTASGASISGSFPLTGNTMSVSSATLATVALGTATPSTSAIDAGQTDYTVWKDTVTIGNRDVNLERLTLRQIGSISTSDLTNFNFYVNGVKYGSTSQLGSDNYVTFDFSNSPVLLQTGSKNLEVRADVVGGSSKNFSFSLQRATDIAVKDSQYNVYVKATSVPATTGTMSVNAGTMTVTKMADSPSGNITKDASNVTIAKYEFKAYGESTKIEYLKVGFSATLASGSLGKLRNGAIYANGAQIGSTADILPGGTDFSLGSALVVNPGSPVTVEIKADMYDNDGTNTLAANDTITPSLGVYTNNAERLTSLGYYSVPASSVAGNVLTVKVGTLSLSKQSTYGDQTTVVPQTAYKLGSFILSGNSIEDVNVNSLDVTFTGADAFTVSKLTDVYLKYGSKTTSVKSTVSSGTNSWPVSTVLGKDDNMVIEVYGNIDSTAYDTNGTADTMQAALSVEGTTVDSSQTANASSVNGQTITTATGSISSALDASSPVSSLLIAGTTSDLASYKFTAINEHYSLTEVVVKVGDDAATNITNMQLKDGSTVLATAPVTGTSGSYHVTFTGLNVPVEANNSKVLTVAATLGDITYSNGTSGALIKATLDSFKANNSQGVESTDTSDRVGSNMYVYKSIPTITNQTLPSTVLTAGTKTLAKISISSDSNPIDWDQIIFNIDKSASTTLSSFVLTDDSGTTINGTFSTSTIGTVATGTTTFVPSSEQAVSGTKTYILKANIGGTIASNDHVSINILSDSYQANDTVANSTSNNFVWSDESAANHSTATSDWTGGNLVKNLPTDSQTLTAN